MVYLPLVYNRGAGWRVAPAVPMTGSELDTFCEEIFADVAPPIGRPLSRG
jgi:hypothetical protein